MKCPYCGSYNENHAKFCKECGKSLNPVSTLKREHLLNHDKVEYEQSENYDNPSTLGSSKNLIIICFTVIICIGLIMGTVFYIASNVNHSNNAINSSNLNNSLKRTDNGVTQANTENISDSGDIDDDSELTEDDMDYSTDDPETNPAYKDIQILSGSFKTGNKLSDKTYCKVYVGDENAGTKLKIQVLYSRNGNTLNPGNIVPKTVDNKGYVSLRSANAFKYYPDNAVITLYDLDNNVLDSIEVTMSANKGTQTF